MSNFFIVLSQYIMVYQLISNVGVWRTRSRYASYTKKSHRVLSADLMAKKLGIGLENSKCTIESTTQYNVISDIKLVTWRYRTDLLSQRLRRLNWIFYADTLFAKYNSIVDNTCAHINTDWEFMQINPIKSKSEADISLVLYSPAGPNWHKSGVNRLF